MLDSLSCLTKPPQRSPLFPYTTLFRSQERLAALEGHVAAQRHHLGLLRQRDPPVVLLPADHADGAGRGGVAERSEEHTSELQSRYERVCRLLLEEKNYARIYELQSKLE